MSDPTPQEIQAAIESGKKAFGDGMGSHLSNGKARHQHTNPVLIRAWAEGYDSARLKSL
jgi:hypothetical protein